MTELLIRTEERRLMIDIWMRIMSSKTILSRSEPQVCIKTVNNEPHFCNLYITGFTYTSKYAMCVWATAFYRWSNHDCETISNATLSQFRPNIFDDKFEPTCNLCNTKLTCYWRFWCRCGRRNSHSRNSGWNCRNRSHSRYSRWHRRNGWNVHAKISDHPMCI